MTREVGDDGLAMALLDGPMPGGASLKAVSILPESLLESCAPLSAVRALRL